MRVRAAEHSDKIQTQKSAGSALKENSALPMKLRIDTPIEIDYYRHGGILPFVLRQLLAKQ
jgi:aconitate hydratase